MDLAPTITKERLQQDQNLAERTNLSFDNILKLSDFVLNHNYFKYDGNHCKQIFGCAMGSPISPVLADLGPVSRRARKAICGTANPLFWKADLLTCFQGNKKQNDCEV